MFHIRANVLRKNKKKFPENTIDVPKMTFPLEKAPF